LKKYLLDKWDALELFYRLAKKSVSENNWKSLDECLLSFPDEETCKPITRKVFPNGPSSMIYQLSLHVRGSKPFVIEASKLKTCLSFIGDEEFSNRERQAIEPYADNPKHIMFERTEWHLYFFDEMYKKENSENPIRGVTRNILKFGKFGRVTVDRFRVGEKEIARYTGYWDLVDNDLAMSIKLKSKNPSRELELYFYIGKITSVSLFEFVLGRAVSQGDTMWARSVIMIENDMCDKSSPSFYSNEDSKFSNPNIPEFIWRFFEDREYSTIRIPIKILDHDYLNDFIRARKERKDKEFDKWGKEQKNKSE
jgi:hypothetical protein